MIIENVDQGCEEGDGSRESITNILVSFSVSAHRHRILANVRPLKDGA